MSEKPPVRINTKISHELNEWLDKRSREVGISKSALVAISVENYRKETETIAILPDLMSKLEELELKVQSSASEG